MFDENSLFTLVLKGATKQNTTEITCLFIFLLCFPSTRKEEEQERRYSRKSFFVFLLHIFSFNLKHRAFVFFWKSPYFIINILYPGWPLSPVMANQHTQATAAHSNYSNQSN